MTGTPIRPSHPVQIVSGECSMVEGFRYRRELDGLRAVAVLAVLLFHAGLGLPGGFVGVDVFFVLSGYLITSLIIRDLELGVFTFPQFWERRARRILPASAVVVAASIAAGAVLLMPSDYAILGKSAVATALCAANVFFWRCINYFTTAADEMPLLHMWSLAVEEQFYFIVPVLLRMCSRSTYFTRPTLLLCIGTLCLGSLGLAVWLVPRAPAAAFYLLPSRAWELGVGAFVAVWPPLLMPEKQFMRATIAWLGLIAIGVPCVVYDKTTPFPGLAAVPPCVGAALFILSTARPIAQAPPFPVRVLSCWPVVAVGLASYSLYLWHWPIFAFARYWTLQPLPLTMRATLCLLAAIAAWLSYLFVESPFRTQRAASNRVALFGSAATVLFALAAGGVAITAYGGFPGRFAPAMLELVRGEVMTPAASSATLADVRKGRLPILGNRADPLQLLVWGDSHAMAILPAVELLCKERRVSACYAVHSSTAPVIDYVHTDRYSRGSAAPAFAAAVIDYVRESRVPNVLLAARWSGYLAKTERTSHHATIPLSKGSDAGFEESLIKTLVLLREAGAQPWVLTEVPAHPVDVPKALRTKLLFGTNPDCYRATAAIYSLQNNDMHFLQAAIRDAGARCVDVSDYLFDPETNCYLIEAHGAPLYIDQHHLSEAGAVCVAAGLGEIFDTRRSSPLQ